MIESIYNFLRLSENIATSGQPTKEQLKEIGQAGYEVVINLGLTESDYALEDEEGLVRDLGMKYVHIPVIWEDPTPENLEEFLSIMEIHQENKVFVHCAANMRVSVFMALYRVLRLGWKLEHAMGDVHKIWVPNAIWTTFIQQTLRS
jgi:uncharacterized protein (TIGR01244 family)